MILSFDVSIENAIELYFTHYKYGLDYTSTTVLVDANYNIIAFYDHGTPNIDVIMVPLFYKWGIFVANWITVHSTPPKLLYYNKQKNRNLPKDIRRENYHLISEYNKNYFKWDYINKQPLQLLWEQLNNDMISEWVEKIW